jgi:hypothetical protein
MTNKNGWKDTSQEIYVRGESIRERGLRLQVERTKRKKEAIEKRRLKEIRRIDFNKKKAIREEKKRKKQEKYKSKPEWYPPEWVFKSVKKIECWRNELAELDCCLIFEDGHYVYINSNSPLPENDAQYGDKMTQELHFSRDSMFNLCSELGQKVSFWDLPAAAKRIGFIEIGYNQ